MNIKKVFKNVAYAFMAQGISLILSAAISLFVPRFIGVKSFGYFQLFMFYSSYATFFHFGLNDGIYLKQGGSHFSDLCNSKISGQFFLSAGYLILVGTLISFIGMSLFDGPRLFVILSFSLYLVLYDLNNLLGSIFQACNRITDYALSVTIEKIVAASGIVLCLLLGVSDFYPFIDAFILGKIVSLIYCCWSARELLRIRPDGLKVALYEAFSNIQVGIKLTMANSAALMITGIARFFVDGSFGIAAFGQVSMALSLCNFILAFESQVGMVLFPALRQSSNSELQKTYSIMRNGISLLLPFVLLSYYPIVAVLGVWLPKYTAAFGYFAVVIPLSYFDGKANILFNTYLKVYRKEAILLAINLIAVCMSAIFEFLAAVVFHNLLFVFIGILVVVITRNVLLEAGVSRTISQSIDRRLLIEILFSLLFVCANSVLSRASALFVTVLLSLLYFFAFRFELLSFRNRLFKRFAK